MSEVDDDDCPGGFSAVEDLIGAALRNPHPGTALQEGHRKALVWARNEGLEKARRMAANVGLGNLASVIDAAKEPES
jgi:hypothetical protein